jgi:chromosome segregation ATPase
MPSMSDEPLTRAVLASTLAEFHRTIVLPDIRQVVGEIVGEFRREINGHFDDLYGRLARLETEYVFIKAGLARVEQRLDGIDGRLDGIDGRLDRIDGRLDGLELGQAQLRDAIQQLDGRLGRVEIQLRELAAAAEKQALRSEAQDLKTRVDALSDDIRRLEQRLQA